MRGEEGHEQSRKPAYGEVHRSQRAGWLRAASMNSASSKVNHRPKLTSLMCSVGLDKALAREVPRQLSAHDRLKAHLRDELGIDPAPLARPLQAAWLSALRFGSFALAPSWPWSAPIPIWIPTVAGISSLSLVGMAAAW